VLSGGKNHSFAMPVSITNFGRFGNRRIFFKKLLESLGRALMMARVWSKLSWWITGKVGFGHFRRLWAGNDTRSRGWIEAETGCLSFPHRKGLSLDAASTRRAFKIPANKPIAKWNQHFHFEEGRSMFNHSTLNQFAKRNNTMKTLRHSATGLAALLVATGLNW